MVENHFSEDLYLSFPNGRVRGNHVYKGQRSCARSSNTRFLSPRIEVEVSNALRVEHDIHRLSSYSSLWRNSSVTSEHKESGRIFSPWRRLWDDVVPSPSQHRYDEILR